MGYHDVRAVVMEVFVLGFFIHVSRFKRSLTHICIVTPNCDSEKRWIAGMDFTGLITSACGLDVIVWKCVTCQC